MKTSLLSSLLFVFALSVQGQESNLLKKSQHVDFSKVHVNDNFWSPRLQRISTTTIPVCIDQTEVQTGRIRNFVNVASGKGEHSGIFFDDSDVYKALEAIAYSLINNPDQKLEAKADEWIEKIAAAQQSDGYINTFFTLTGIDKRWTDMDKHEMYCAGHLLEAGVAYYQAKGKDRLLKVGQRMVDHMMSLFGEGKRHWVPGHEEIELALVKLAAATGEKKYADYSYWLLSQRGHGYGHGDGITDDNGSTWNKGYYQDLVPVEQQRSISGHAVRAMYLFCAMCDIAAMRPDTGYEEALDELWHDVVDRNMYITGGIGVAYCTEGFANDYELPNDDAYCETCASVGMALWNMRMNEMTGDSKYIDVMERTIYNGLISGISMKGDKFFYVNPLYSAGDHHRQNWFGCACCPSNVSRFISSIGNYIYSTSDDALYVNLYIGNQSEFAVGNENVNVEMRTTYPWTGSTVLKMHAAMNKKLCLRIPAWSTGCQFKVNGVETSYECVNGYAVIDRTWKAGDFVEISYGMETKMVEADPRVKADEGRRAVQRGPLVYCVEQVDNREDVDNITLTPSTTFAPHYDAHLFDGTVWIDAERNGSHFTLVPYYMWDNRAAGKMAVWLPIAK